MNGINCPTVTSFLSSKPDQSQKPPGRPRKRTPEYFTALLQEHLLITEWFAKSFGREPKSDQELITQYLSTHFMNQGLRASRADSEEVKSKLKSIRNDLSMARTWARTNPHKRHLLGRQET